MPCEATRSLVCELLSAVLNYRKAASCIMRYTGGWQHGTLVLTR